MKPALNPTKTALILVDVQNDFFHPEGALVRSGFDLTRRRSFIESLIKLCDACRDSGMLMVASSFTLIADTKNAALVPLFLKDLGVKLVRGDFQVSKWGHQVIEEVQPVNYVMEKTGPSAFFRTELDLILRHHDISTVVIAGLNGTRSVVATAYDAMSLGLQPIVMSDGSTDIDEDGHVKLMEALQDVLDIRQCKELVSTLKNTAQATA
ncbi:MAG: isochorismatase family cysteine hydrolase [Saprospiraceae bacterium]